MRVVVQRVQEAVVWVGRERVGAIGPGLVGWVAVERDDDPATIAWVARKLVGLRLFGDERGRLERSVGEVGGAVLLVSNFTVAGRVGKGNRPDFGRAAPAVVAEQRFAELVAAVEAAGVPVATGRFGADMAVHMVADGPVTVVVERSP